MKKRELLKRTMAVVLASAMVMGSSTTAFAASAGNTFVDNYATDETKDVTEAASEAEDLAEAAEAAAEAAKQANEDAQKAADEAQKLANAASDAIDKKAEPAASDAETTVNEANTKIEAAVNDAEDATDNITKDAAAITEDAKIAADAETTAKQQADEAKKALNKAMNTEAATEEEKYEDAKQAAAEAEAAANAAKDAEAAAKAAYDDATKKLEDAEQQLKDLEDAAKTAEDEIAAAQKALEAAKKQVEDAEKDLNEAKEEYQSALSVHQVAAQAEADAADAASKAKEANDAATKVENKLAEVNNGEGTTLEDLQQEADEKAAALEDAKKSQNIVNAEQDAIIADASATKAAKESEIDSLKNSVSYKSAVDTVKGMTNSEYNQQSAISKKKAGDYKFPFGQYTQEEIDAAKAKVAAYDEAKKVKENTEKQIAGLQSEADAQQKKIEDAEAAKKTESDKVLAATTASNQATMNLNAVKSYVYADESFSLELTKEEQEEYKALLAQLKASNAAFTEVADDTIKYIAATDKSLLDYLTGLFNGKTFGDLNTELKLESKYHGDAVYDRSTGTYYIIQSDKNNSKYLIALGNERCRITKIDEIEAATYSASFDAVVAAEAAKQAAEAASKEAEALKDYQQALKDLQAAKEKLEKLQLNKGVDQAVIDAAKQAVADAKETVDETKTDYEETQEEAAIADNYAKWTKALATKQKSHTYAQLIEGTKDPARENALEYDMTDEKVVSRSPSKFTSTLAYVDVPYDVFKKFVNSMLNKNYTYDQVSTNKKGRGQGAALEPVFFWEMNENGKITGSFIEGIENLEVGKTYFVPYTLKIEGVYHLDGYLIEIEETPEEIPEEIPTPGTEPGTTTPDGGSTPDGATVTIEDGNTPLAATPNAEQAVLGARRVQAMGTGDQAVLGAKRSVDQAVLGKRRRPETGDSMASVLWMITLGVSAAAVTVSAMQLKKKKENDL